MNNLSQKLSLKLRINFFQKNSEKMKHLYEDRKRSFFANENTDSAGVSVRKNISIRKNHMKEKIFLKRLSYSNGVQNKNFFEVNIDLIELPNEEKTFTLNDMVFLFQNLIFTNNFEILDLFS